MSLISTYFPGMSYLTRLIAYTDNPTIIGGIDFVGPLALKALERFKENQGSTYPIKLNNELNLDEHLDEAWIIRIQKAVENLPLEVIENLSTILNTFLLSKEEAKSELALLFIKTIQENNIDLLNIFKDSLNDQEAIFKKFKSNLKQLIHLFIEKDLSQGLLNWTIDTEYERIDMIYAHHKPQRFSRPLTGLNQAKKEEIYALNMRYFHLMKEVDRTLYSNHFFLSFYEKTDELFWEEEIEALLKSNEMCHAKRASLKEEQAKELLNIHERYDILFKKEKEHNIQCEETLRVQREIERKREIELNLEIEKQNREIKEIEEQILNVQNQLNPFSQNEIDRLKKALQQQNDKKKKCIVM